jgi:translation initiation factor 4G
MQSNLKPTAKSFTPASAPSNGGSSWETKPSTAVRSAPPPPQNPLKISTGGGGGGGGNQHKSKDNGWRQPNKNGGGSNDWQQSNRGKNHRGSDQNSGRGNNNRRKNKQQSNDGGGSWKRGQSITVELLKEGGGATDAAKAVKRITAEVFLSLRLQFLDAPAVWATEEASVPPPKALWDDEDRVAAIQEIVKQPRKGGDVSPKNKKKVETAPPVEECAPLVVNDETRWKAKVFTGDKVSKADTTSDEDILKKALLILNKLSLTKFDKLSDEFIQTGIGRNEECLKGAIGLVVDKAQQEPHFSAMYASLCVKLSKTPMEALGEQEGKKGKKFKKMLLSRCQDEFEQDTATKIEVACKGITDKEEITYQTGLIKKNYLGHMRFIGELYKGDLVSIRIILSVIPHLLDLEEGEVDEEKVECFAKLMTTIGASLDAQCQSLAAVGKTSSEESLKECWDHVVELTTAKGAGSVSSRIRFMLQDLMEMRKKGWVTRRKEETAKTIDEIHKEVAKEEARAARCASSGNLHAMGKSSSNMRRLMSMNDVRKMVPQKDDDGFVQVQRGSGVAGGFSRVRSSNNMRRNTSSSSISSKGSNKGSSRRFSGGRGSEPRTVEKSRPARTFSGGALAALNEDKGKSLTKGKRSSGNLKNTKASATTNRKSGKSNRSKSPPLPPTCTSKPLKVYTPDECQEKTKNILKEYFVGGDTDDAVLSFHELINPSADGSKERASAIVEAGTLLVMEMKLSDVDNFLAVLIRSFKADKITSETIQFGLCDPLEFLNDIAIDAPLAPVNLCRIISMLIKEELIGFDCLLKSPYEFKTYGNPANFASKVLKELGEDAMKNESNKDVVRELMTEDDKSQFASVDEIISSV